MEVLEKHGDATQKLTPVEQIEIILHEYDTLRDELVENVSRQQTLLTIWVTLLIAFLAVSIQTGDLLLATLLPITILLIVSLEASRQFSMLLKSSYVRVLEQQINELAEKPLLTWEYAGSAAHLSIRVRSNRLGEDNGFFNSNWLITGFLPVMMLVMFLIGLYLGGTYLYNVLPFIPLAKIAAVVFYQLFHLVILMFILFSRIFQERKILSVYIEGIQKLREI